MFGDTFVFRIVWSMSLTFFHLLCSFPKSLAQWLFNGMLAQCSHVLILNDLPSSLVLKFLMHVQQAGLTVLSLYCISPHYQNTLSIVKSLFDSLDPIHKEALVSIVNERYGESLEIITKAMGRVASHLLPCISHVGITKSLGLYRVLVPLVKDCQYLPQDSISLVFYQKP